MAIPFAARLAFFTAALMTCAVSEAALTVSPTSLEIGVLASGSSRAEHLTLTNSGDAPLKLTAVEVECAGCTKVQFAPTTLEKGKSLDLPVTFKPPPDDNGRIRRSVTIKTDDPKQPSITVPLNAFVTAVAGIWPAELSPEAPKAPGSDVELRVELVNVSDKPLLPLYAVGPVDGPKLTVPHVPIAAGAKATLTAKWHLPAKLGQTTGQLVLYVDHPKLTQLTIPYAVTIQAAAVTQPAPAPATAPSGHAAGTPPTNGAMAAVEPSTPALSPTAEASATAPAEMLNLDLKESLPLKDFVDIVAAQLKFNLIYDEAALNVPVSIRLNGPLPADALLPLLKTLLQAKGLAIVPTDRSDIWRIVTSKEAQAMAEPGHPAGAQGPAQIVTEFITPKSVDVETAAGLLRGFLTPNVGQLTTVPRVKSLIVTDYSSQLARLRRLMDLIDKPQATASVELIPLKSAEAGPLADRITKLLVQISKAEGRASFENVFVTPAEEGGATGGIMLVGPESDLPRVTALIRQFDTAPTQVRVDYPVSDQNRTQALDTIRQVVGTGAISGAPGADGMPRIVTAPQRISVLATEGQQRRIKDLLAGVSTPDDDGGIQLKAYRIQNRDASELYATLTRLVGDSRGISLGLQSEPLKTGASGLSTPSISNEGVTRVGSLPADMSKPPPEQPVAGPSGMRPTQGSSSTAITIDQGTNTLLIAATADTHRRLQSLITELDRKQAQVLLEVMLVSVADSDTFSAAVEAAVKASFAGSTLGIGTDAGIGGGDFVNGRTPTEGTGFNTAIFNPASFSVFMRALQQTNKARVMSVPQVLALDNKPALLRSIQQEPFTSVNASTTVATTSFGGFAEAGTTLELTPHIAPADYLNLEYRLEVSSFTGNSAGNGVPPPKRSDAVTSFVSVPDGSTVVLGGLRSSNVSKTVAKVPGLGEIPILGWIGRNESSTNSTAAFYVFVRPTILRASKFEDLISASLVSKQSAGVKGDYPETELHFMRDVSVPIPRQ
jgi:general secretion pathway protein D